MSCSVRIFIFIYCLLFGTERYEGIKNTLTDCCIPRKREELIRFGKRISEIPKRLLSTYTFFSLVLLFCIDFIN